MADPVDLQRISGALRNVGWVRFWTQLALSVVVVGVLWGHVAVWPVRRVWCKWMCWRQWCRSMHRSVVH